MPTKTTSTTPTTFLIDTDTASDDAVALIMALRDPRVRVAAVTTVSGNVPLAQATQNALYTLELCGADGVPVFAGCERPLECEPAHAQWFHGADGLGDAGYCNPKRSAEQTNGVDAMVQTIRQNPGLTLVTLGPLTNVARALSRDPGIDALVGRCVVMGGNACCEGNVTPAAEYNIWCDPHAARIVFHSGMPVEMVGWQLCRGSAVLDKEDIEQVRAIGTDLASFAIGCNCTAMGAYCEQTGEEGIALPDPVAMAVALDPSITLEQSSHAVEIETSSPLTRGMTVVDRLNVIRSERNRDLWSGARPVNIIWKIDVPRWKQLLYQSLRR